MLSVVVLSCASEAVKQDSRSRADREMVVCASPPDRFEDVICLLQYLLSESPASTEKKKQRRTPFVYSASHLHKGNATFSRSCRGRHQPRSFSGFLLNRLDRMVEVVAQSNEREGIFTRFVVDATVAVLPMVEDLCG